MSRTELLKKLINLEGLVDEVVQQLEAFGWDSNQDLVVLKKEQILLVLHNYLEGKLSGSEVENWANAIECREDIGAERSFEELINGIIYELANPYLTEKLTKKRAEILINMLA